MFRHFERRYAYFLKVTPPVEECLLVPFYAKGQAVGTIWAIVHDDRRQFDAEDMRQLVSLSRFASSAYQAVASLDAFEQQGEELRENHAELAQTLADLQKANLTAQDSHCAALNLMEQSGQAMERLNVELRASEERFREMIDALPAAIYTTDAEGRVTHFNPAAVELSGRRPVLGEDMWCVGGKLYHPDGTPMPYDECPMAVALREGRVVH
jgi:PAS domain-containing protein